MWKYNEEKTLSWLGIKVNRVANVLEEKNINVNTSCAVSNTFVKTEKDATGIVSVKIEFFIHLYFLVHKIITFHFQKII